MSDRVELADEVKTFVVQALACFDTPSEVAQAVKEQFGVTITRQAVERYDPTKRAGATLSAELRAIFDATRAAFLKEAASVGVMHRSVRIRRLERLADRAEAMGNIGLAAKILEQVAREMGGVFTNKVAIGGDAKAPPVRMEVAWLPPQA